MVGGPKQESKNLFSVVAFSTAELAVFAPSERVAGKQAAVAVRDM